MHQNLEIQLEEKNEEEQEEKEEVSSEELSNIEIQIRQKKYAGGEWEGRAIFRKEE